MIEWREIVQIVMGWLQLIRQGNTFSMETSYTTSELSDHPIPQMTLSLQVLRY